MSVAESPSRAAFIAAVLDAYRRTPGTLGKLRPADRRLAEELHEEGVPLVIVRAAFTLAAARRAKRPPDAVPLGPIRSLHYVLPLIAELLAHPPDAAYLDYLERVRAARHEPGLPPRPPAA